MTDDQADAGRLYEELAESLRAAARRMLPPRGSGFSLVSMDLVQSAWAAQLARGMDVGLDRSKIQLVLYAAMHDFYVDYCRAKRAQRRCGGRDRVILQSEVEGRSHLFDLVELHDALEVMATRIGGEAGPECRQVIELRFLVGLSFAEIQEVMGLGEFAVRSRFRAALAWLGKRLGGEEGA